MKCYLLFTSDNDNALVGFPFREDQFFQPQDHRTGYIELADESDTDAGQESFLNQSDSVLEYCCEADDADPYPERDFQIVLSETPHGTRYWTVVGDPDTASDRKHVSPVFTEYDSDGAVLIAQEMYDLDAWVETGDVPNWIG